MARSLPRWLVLVFAALVGGAIAFVQPDGRGDSGRSAAERDGEVVDLRTVTVELGGGVSMGFVLIPAGKFLMGSSKEEKERSKDEGPLHEVTISRAFYLGKDEVTQEQYQQIVDKNPSPFSAGGEYKQKVAGLDTRRFPVENVSWEDATAFCRKLSARDGKRRFRLPTEAEWEYACRAGTRTPFHFGDSLNGDEANCDGTKALHLFSFLHLNFDGLHLNCLSRQAVACRACRAGVYGTNRAWRHHLTPGPVSIPCFASL